MKKILLFLFLTVYMLAMQALPAKAEITGDPNLLWISDSIIVHGFAIHPNGNIICYNSTKVFEIDGATGKIIRYFPTIISGIENISISKNGKYFIGGTTIVDYDSAKIIKDVPQTSLPNFFPDNQRIISFYSSLFKIDDILMDTSHSYDGRYGYYNLPYWLRYGTLSNDGKYFATGGSVDKNPPMDYNKYAIFILWDAVAMKPIADLEKVTNESEYYDNIKFSANSKFVTYRKANVKIFDTESHKLIRTYNPNIFSDGIFVFCFINDLLVALTGSGTQIRNIATDAILYNTNSYGSNYCMEYNKIFNSLIIQYDHGLVALNIPKILSTDVKEKTIENPLSIKYFNDTVIIDNSFDIGTQITISIVDINGNILNTIPNTIETTGTSIRIPIKLPIGAYFVKITNENQEYSNKFIINQ